MKKKSKKVSKKEVPKKKSNGKPYHLEIKVNDVEFKTNAKSLENALAEFVASPDYPIGAKTIALVKFSKGKKEGKRIWHTPEARRIFKTIALKPSHLAVLAAKFTEELNA